MEMNDTLAQEVQHGAAHVERIRGEIGKILVGQAALLDEVLIALLAEGHVLIEGVPGLGKTLLVKALARAINTQFSRIQFTPDLMPSDITGHAVFNMQTQVFDIRKGPVFTNLLLADEINRAPAKTQAALLEVMQEKQVTIEGQSFISSAPFMVLATQNPVEQDGTYPLPEAELDRFVMKVTMDYPAHTEERLLAARFAAPRDQNEFSLADVVQVANDEDIRQLQNLTRRVTLTAPVLDYIVSIVRATREWPGFARGAGPRATLALISCGKALALANGMPFVTPDNVKQVAPAVLRHRVQLSADMVIEGAQADNLIADILQRVEAPKQ
jgi:MoxR-like ATPase